MKNRVAKIAVVGCLLTPMLSHASQTTTYSGGTFSDALNFSVSGSALYDALATYSWADLELSRGSTTNYYDAVGGSLAWTLTKNGGTVATGVISDTAANAGQGNLSFSNLGSGAYVLSLAGTWNGVTLSSNGWKRTSPVVDLCPVQVTAAVPEPGSYAMLLGGLGVMASVARRRRSRG